ncbi:MAG: oxygenase MpaB family protein [Akkermansiaceae bacterium]|nr:oxygenase MpaB family protein [Akkermansiaceae bacterium]
MANNPIQEFFAKRMRRLLSNSEDGMPPWVDEIDTEEGAGYYLPHEAPWVVHANLGTLVGGIRALLMQALHPGSLAGVRDHSRYKDDPLGRLAGTIRWLTITTFGSKQAIGREAARVMGMHAKVRGDYQPAKGGRCPYRAADKDLLLWVHVAFMDSFLRAHELYTDIPIPGGSDAYVRLWARSVEPLGLSQAPKTESELRACLEEFRPKLVVSDDTREVLHWIKYPPLPLAARPIYRLLFQAAVVSMPDGYRELLGFHTLPDPVVMSATRAYLKLMRLAIGPDSPLEEAGIERLKRAGLVEASS